MKRLNLLIAILTLATLTQAQSLGDVARQQKQKQQSKLATPHKVITNDDIPSQTEDTTDSSSTDNANAKEKKSSSSVPPKPDAQGWKSTIQQQKASVDTLERQVTQMKSSIHYVTANGYTNGVQYNQAQLHEQQAADRLQKQLDEQKKSLNGMQESCRRAGLGSAICQP